MVPYQALENQAGSCAAEAFYVAWSLLNSGLCEERDLSLGVFNSHGQEVRVELVGKTKLNPGHAVLFVTIDNQTYELSFRMNRADEDPTIERITENSLSEDRLKWVEPIDEALKRYGEELHDNRGYDISIRSSVADPNQTDTAAEVRFDQEF